MSMNLEVRILGEYKSLTRATKGATQQLKGLQNSARGISRSINATLATIGVGLSLNALRNFLGSAITEASNLEESVNAVKVAFGAAGDSVLALGENSSTAFGLATSQFNQAAVTFSAFADEIVGPGGDVANFIETITQRGADFASVFNIEASEALRVFRSGLSGETEPLKRFGIILNETAVKQYALESGLIETNRELTNQEKVLARYQLLLQETSATQGDFANTADSMANALRIARAGFADVRAAIGEGFTPAISAAAQFVSNNIATFEALGEAIGTRLRAAFEDTGNAATAFGGKLIALVEDLTAFLNGSKDANNVFVKLNEDLSGLFSVVDGFVSIVRGAVAVLDGFVQGLFGWLELLPGVESGTVTFGNVLKAFGQFLQDVGKTVGFVVSLFVPFGQGVLIVGKAITSFLKGGKGFFNIFKDIGGVVNNTVTALRDLSKGVLINKGKFLLFGLGVKNSLTGVSAATDEVKSKFDEYTRKLDAQDNKRITNYIDIVTTNISGNQLIPASPTTENRPAGPLKPGYTERFINWRDGNQWYTRTWTGYEWKITKDADAYKAPSGTGQTTFQQNVQRLVDTLSDSLTDARNRIKGASESFRDAVSLAFGVITNGAFAVFDINRVLRQMRRLVDGAKNFAKDIKQLQREGADQSLIDQLLGMDPLAGAATARGLLSSGRLQEFLDIRSQLAGIGAGAGGVANFGIYGTGTGGLSSAIESLTKTLQRGYGNTYTINVNNANKMSGQEIVAAIKKYEKTTGRPVL